MKSRKDISKLTESQIVELAKKDQKYFGVLYDNYFEKIFCFVFKRLGGDEDNAGDITQTAFLKAMANIHKYEDRGFSFGSWLFKIAQNEVMIYFRKAKKNISVPVDENRIQDMASEANISHMSIEEQELLVDILNSLKSEHADLIELRFFQQLSFKEIADIYDITEANAKMKIYRILKKISDNWSDKK